MQKRVTLAPPIRRRPFPTKAIPVAQKSSTFAPNKPDTDTPQYAPLKGGYQGVSRCDDLAQDKSFTEIQEQLTNLDPKQKQALVEKLLLDLHVSKSSGSGSVRDLEMWTVAVSEALRGAIGIGDGGGPGSVILKRQLGHDSSWSHVRDFMSCSKLMELTVVERQQCYNMLANLLVKHAGQVARRSGAPLSGKLVSNCTGNLHGVFDQCFPGYVKAGLAKVVVRQAVR